MSPAETTDPHAGAPPAADEPQLHSSRRNLVWFSCQHLLQILFTVWFRYRARGAARLPTRQGALLLINHQSYLDPLLVGVPLERAVSYVARDSLFRVPVIGWILRNTYVIPINRRAAGPSSLRRAARRLSRGFLVGIFPEGTRSRDGSIGRLKPGFITLIRRTNAAVYPVGIAGARDAMPRGAWLVRPARVRVVIGDPFTPAEVADLAQHGREDILLTAVRERIEECQQEAEEWRRG